MRAPPDEFQDESFDSLGMASPVAVFRAADDSLVAEVHPPMGAAALSHLLTAARSRGIGAIWVRGDLVSGDIYGFERRRGCARLEADNPLTEIDAARPPLALVPQLQVACFSGVWGHHRPALEPDPDATFVGLHEAGAWVGICEVDLERNEIDSPGLLAPFRTADRYARLVRAKPRRCWRRAPSRSRPGETRKRRCPHTRSSVSSSSSMCRVGNASSSSSVSVDEQ